MKIKNNKKRIFLIPKHLILKEDIYIFVNASFMLSNRVYKNYSQYTSI